MVGKNNYQVKKEKQSNKFYRYSIKRLSVGVASVAVAAGLLFAGDAVVVEAAAAEEANTSEELPTAPEEEVPAEEEAAPVAEEEVPVEEPAPVVEEAPAEEGPAEEEAPVAEETVAETSPADEDVKVTTYAAPEGAPSNTSSRAAADNPAPNKENLDTAINQEIPFKEETFGKTEYEPGDAGPIRYNTAEVMDTTENTADLAIRFWPFASAAGRWGAVEGTTYPGRYVISFENPDFYQNIASVETTRGNGPLGSTTWASATSGRDWTMPLTNANLQAGITGSISDVDVRITLKEGTTFENLGLAETPLPFTVGMVTGEGAGNDFNLIEGRALDNGFILRNNPNNPDPEENPELFAPHRTIGATGESRFADGKFYEKGMSHTVYFDETTNSIVSRHTVQPDQNFSESSFSNVHYFMEQIPKVLVPYIDKNSVKIGVMNDVSNPNLFRNSVNRPIDPIPLVMDDSGLVDSRKTPAISITHADPNDRQAQRDALRNARNNINSKILEGTLGQPRTYSIVYPLAEGYTTRDVAQAMAEYTQNNNNKLLFETWVEQDFVDTPGGPLNGQTPYADNGEPTKRLIGSYGNAYFDAYYELSLAATNDPETQLVETEVGTVPPAEDGISNKADLPEGTSFSWEEEPDVSQVTAKDEEGNDIPQNARVKVTYSDGSSEVVNVPVVVREKTEKDADKYTPEAQPVEKAHGEAATEDDVTNAVKVPNFPTEGEQPGVTVDDTSQLPDGTTPGTTDVPVTVTYPDGSEDKLTVPVTIAEPEAPAETDADKYDPTAETVTKPNGEAATEEDVTNAVTFPDFPAEGEQPSVTVDDPSQLPDGQTPGTTDVPVTVTYPDGSEDKLTVPVTVEEATETDADKYDPTAKPVTKPNGEAATEEEVKNAVTVPNFPTEGEQPSVKVDDPSQLPDGQNPGTTDVPVTVTYPDGSEDKLTVPVTVEAPTETDADKYDPSAKEVTKDHGQPAREDDVKGAVTVPNFPEDGEQPSVTVDDRSQLPDGQTPGTTDVDVTVTYPDGSEDKVKVPVTVKEQSVADKYEPSAEEVAKDHGQAASEDDVKGAVTVPNYPATAEKPSVTVDDPSQLPDGQTPGTTEVPVTVTYPDGSEDKLTVPVTVAEPEAPKTEVGGSVKSVEPSDEKQGTGITVTNPDESTTVTASDEDGEEIPAEINPETGEVEVTPGTDVDGPIDVVINDEDLPNGKATIPVPVNGHEEDRDDNGSEEKPATEQTSIDDSNVTPVDPTKDQQSTGVVIVNPDADTEVTAKDEDGKDVPVEVTTDENGRFGDVKVTPGTDVDGPITVTIKDPELPEGQEEVTVPVNGHEAGRDDNGSEEKPATEQTRIDDSNLTPVDPTEDQQSTGVVIVNPDADTEVTAKDEDGKDVPVEVTTDENGRFGDVKVTPGTDVDGPITVTIKDPELPGGQEEVTVPVNGHEAGRDDNAPKTEVGGSVGSVNPTDEKQGTGIIVTNPDESTTVTASDEDGKDIPAEINPETGEVEVTPGTDVDGPIDVVINDEDLPNGKATIPVTVNGHEEGRDDNGSESEVGHVGIPRAENEIGKDTTTVTALTDPNTDVEVTDQDGKTIASGTSNGEGEINLEVPKQKANSTITIVPGTKDEQGNFIPSPDKAGETVVRETPVITTAEANNEANSEYTVVSGKTTVPGAEIDVEDKDGNFLFSTIADENGDFSFKGPRLEPGTVLVLKPLRTYWMLDDTIETHRGDSVEVTVTGPNDDNAPKTEVGGSVGSVNPTDEKQGTGIIVINPDDKTSVSAKDEDGKDIPAEINPETGEIEVTPGTDVDGPIKVVIEDEDLPRGKATIPVTVNGHEEGRDDNGSDTTTPPTGGDTGETPGDGGQKPGQEGDHKPGTTTPSRPGSDQHDQAPSTRPDGQDQTPSREDTDQAPATQPNRDQAAGQKDEQTGAQQVIKNLVPTVEAASQAPSTSAKKETVKSALPQTGAIVGLTSGLALALIGAGSVLALGKKKKED